MSGQPAILSPTQGYVGEGRPVKVAALLKRPWIYSPAHLDVELHGIEARYDLQVRYLLNSIFYYKTVGRRDEKRYVELSTSFLGPLFGDSKYVKPVRDMCVKAKLVESDGHYIPGVKSIGYRLGERIRDRKFERWYLERKRAEARFGKWKAALNDRSELDELGIYLAGWIDRVEFKGDVARTIAGMPPAKAEVAWAQMDYLRQGIVHLNYCRFGRFHSPYTRLCSELRRHMTIHGQPLGEVDVVNSQPTFLAGIVNDAAAISSHSPVFSTPITNHHPTTTPQYNPIPYECSSDLQGFIQDVQNGVIYERFQQANGIATRAEAKDKFFKAVYGRACNLGPFERIYPTVAGVLRSLKTEHTYKWVPQEMQRRESQVVLRGAADRLRRDHPDVPVVSVHDSIMTTTENLDLVRQVIQEAFAGQAVTPKLRIKGETL
jgi:hypothetical protein